MDRQVYENYRNGSVAGEWLDLGSGWAAGEASLGGSRAWSSSGALGRAPGAAGQGRGPHRG